MWKKIAWVLVSLVVILLLVLGAGAYYLLRRPLPVTRGKLQVRGLEAPVKVFRDGWGLPHIYAANEHDLLFAQGFVQAQDRLWQMELNRRLAAGRLSEIFGPAALEADRWLRTLGLMRAARQEAAQTDPDGKRLLQAFADGVNALVARRGNRLPFEFLLLGFKPEPWRPEDSLAWAKFMALSGGKNWEEELVRSLLHQKLGPQRFSELAALANPETPTIIPPGLNLAGLVLPGPARQPLFGFALAGASNNWAVSGSRTATGGPLLANDMHLPVNIPSVWYEMHLVGGKFDVIGLSLAGLPLIIAGHNQKVAWGITYAYVDVQDLYLERMNPDQPGQYLFAGQWQPARLIKEPIRIKGRETPEVHEVWVTRHGPLISGELAAASEFSFALAMKWSAHEPGNVSTTLSRLNLAQNWDQFKAAALKWSEPAINLAYADREGHIGYVLGSRIPRRAQGQGLVPVPGWTGEHEWEGYLDGADKPAALDPERGFLATANNRLTGPDYPHYLSADFLPGFRAARIEEVLAGQTRVSVENCRDLQGDRGSVFARRFVRALEGLEAQSPAGRDLLGRLRAWDQRLGPESVGAAVYAVLLSRLLENTFRDEMGPVADRFFGQGLTPLESINSFAGHSRVILVKLLSNPDSPWFDDQATPARESLAEVLDRSLEETASFLKEKLGPDPETWRWGRLHLVNFEHPLGQVKPLDRLLNLGPYEGGGDITTVCQSTVPPGMDFRLAGATVSNRHIYDLKDWDQSLGAIVPGQSGLPTSPHYADQVELWLKVGHHPLPYSRAQVEAQAREVLVLRP